LKRKQDSKEYRPQKENKKQDVKWGNKEIGRERALMPLPP